MFNTFLMFSLITRLRFYCSRKWLCVKRWNLIFPHGVRPLFVVFEAKIKDKEITLNEAAGQRITDNNRKNMMI